MNRYAGVPLNRREFLRACLLATGGAVAAACQQKLQTVVATATSIATSIPPVKLNLGADQDAWAWVKQIRVGVSEGAGEKLLLQVNAEQFEARPEIDSFVADIELAAGENQVTAVCTQPDGHEVRSEPVIYNVRLRPGPKAVIEISLNNGQIILDGSQSIPSEADETPIADYIWSARAGNPEPLQMQGGDLSADVNGQSISIVPPATDGEYYLTLLVRDQAERVDTSTTYFVVEDGQPRIPDYDHENPAWVETAIVYGIVPFLFGNPAFNAIRSRLDDLADLGINVIWLGPSNTHPADDYGYHVEDYFALDPAYGTDEDFRAMVQAAHERGIRVLMDFVPNHTSNTHPYFLDAEERGPQSPYWEFHGRDENGNHTYQYSMGWNDLPDLNYDNPDVWRMIIEAFSYWVREFDVDGFRVDAAWAIRNRRPDFWPDWRRELKRIKPDLMLLAEAPARDPFYFENGFDVAYDWTDHPGAWAWDIVWTAANQYRLLGYNLTTALMNRPEGYHPDALIFRFLNNNDTYKRFISRHGEARTRVATALLLTLPGVPCLYTGDEYGLEFEPYQQLEPLIFEEQYPGLRDYHKKLIALRKELPSLHSRQWALIKPDAMRQEVFVYLRYSEESDVPILVLLNFSEEPAQIRFDVPEQFGSISTSDNLDDLLAEESLPAIEDGRIRVSVPAWTARILAREKMA